jgi:hypothetical protein
LNIVYPREFLSKNETQWGIKNLRRGGDSPRGTNSALSLVFCRGCALCLPASPGPLFLTSLPGSSLFRDLCSAVSAPRAWGPGAHPPILGQNINKSPYYLSYYPSGINHNHPILGPQNRFSGCSAGQQQWGPAGCRWWGRQSEYWLWPCLVLLWSVVVGSGQWALGLLVGFGWGGPSAFFFWFYFAPGSGRGVACFGPGQHARRRFRRYRGGDGTGGG